MMKGVTNFTAQQLDYKRITADMQAHNSCCATDGSDFSGNRYLLFQQLILLLTTTYKSFLRCLFLLNSCSNPHQQHRSFISIKPLIHISAIFIW